jgi:hypothetical protein
MGVVTAASVLSACAGSGGNVAPGPATVEQPPNPTAQTVSPPARLGLAGSQPFATTYVSVRPPGAPRPSQNQTLEIRYSETTNSYEVRLPGGESGRLEPYFNAGPLGGAATSTASRIVAPDGPIADSRVILFVPGKLFPNLYTSFGLWSLGVSETSQLSPTAESGIFVYGIPSTAADVPRDGRGSYSAVLKGYVTTGPAEDYSVQGTGKFDFDFASGRLTGFVSPQVFDGVWVGISDNLGEYVLKDTSFVPGSTAFSGRFAVPNMPAADSSFSGTFAGPGAAELMGRFNAPFLSNGVAGDMSGVFVGKK